MNAPNRKKQEILSQVKHFSLPTMMSHAFIVITAFLVRKWLGPVQVGIWSVIQVVLTYSTYASLGIVNGLTQQVPFYIGKKEFNKADEIRNVVVSFTIFSAILISVGIVVFAFWRRGSLKEEIFYGLLFAAPIILLARLNSLLIQIIRTYKQFSLAGRQILLSALMNTIFVALFAYRFRLYGFMFATCLSFIFDICYILLHYRITIRWRLNFSLIRELISYGSVLTFVAFLGTTILNMDQILITKMLGLESLGFYSIALLAWNYLYAFPTSVMIVSMPNFQEKFGESERPKHLKNYVSKSVMGLSNTVPFFIASAWFLGPYVVEVFLPKFTPGIGALKFLALGAFFVSIYHPLELFTIVLKKYLILIPLGIVMIGFTVGLNLLTIRAGLGIQGVALAMSLVAFVRFATLYFISTRWIYSGKEFFWNFTKPCLKFAYLVVLLFVLQKIHLSPFEVLNVLIQCLLFLLLYLPMFQELNREFEIIPSVTKYLKRLSTSTHAFLSRIKRRARYG